MPRNTSVTLGEHFEDFITDKIAQGRFGSKSEAVRAAMRLLEEYEQKVDALRAALIEGEESGISNRSIREIAEGLKQKLKNEL